MFDHIGSREIPKETHSPEILSAYKVLMDNVLAKTAHPEKTQQHEHPNEVYFSGHLKCIFTFLWALVPDLNRLCKMVC